MLTQGGKPMIGAN